MPETTIVERTLQETRSHDVLATQARVDAFILAAEAFCRLSGGVYPEGVDQMLTPPAAMWSCRLQASSLNDAWGQPIFYSVIRGELVVRSAGPDGRFATGDDIGTPTGAEAYAERFEIPDECQRA